MLPKKKKLLIMCVILAIAAVLTVVGFLILPEVMTVQLSASGEAGNTAPKALALLAPFVIAAVCAVLFYIKEDGRKLLTVSLVGLFVLVLDFVFNLR